MVSFFSRIGASIFAGALLLVSLALATRSSISTILAKISVNLAAALFKVTHALAQGIIYFTASSLTAARFLMRAPRALFRGRAPVEEEVLPVLPDADDESEKGRRRVISLPAKRERKAERAVSESESEPEVEESPAEPMRDYSEAIVNRRHSERPAVATSDKKKKAPERKKSSEEKIAGERKVYEIPAFELLQRGEASVGSENDSELLEKTKQIEAKLRDFNIQGKVTHVHPGPVITLFEFEPAPGVKVGKIAALQDDLSMSLRASSIRIIAPIPKRGTVGIEVPNKTRDIVRLRDLLESEAFQGADSILSIPIGKDTYGDPVVVDIASMPHLLMAGATGTGKSVCINTILLSLLYRASPADLGLILIDPKVLELSIYEGIPHLRVPVVTVPKQAKAVLDWAVKEMDRRYRLMQRYGVRNIDSYNRIVRGEADPDGDVHEPGVIKLKEEQVVAAGTVEPEAVSEGGDEKSEPENSGFVEELQPLPKIVIVIDELADLMLTVGREIEELITRLAQKARASGIHLIVATQRPSVDVITGLIKANFPARLSFRVTSRIDSRTILDAQGAEKLLGKGDMLFMQPGAMPLRRVHGAFVADAEVKRVTSAIKERWEPCYDERIVAVCEKALLEDGNGSGGEGSGLDDDYDSFYDKAVELVVEKRQASTSMIQRAFRIGYNRAARIIEMMEREGVVGPSDGAKPREVLAPMHE
jgi:S-DNA-T family DNA segregation ATPase FtsK/SpoIIIE